MKVCKDCKLELSLDNFYYSESAADGKRNFCKSCTLIRKKNKGKPKVCLVCQQEYAGKGTKYCSIKCQRHALSIKMNYGLSMNDKHKMFEDQDGLCAACGKPWVGDEKIVVDHNHETGQVRGLLHGKCNLGIGHADDDPEKLVAWAAYLIATTESLAQHVEV